MGLQNVSRVLLQLSAGKSHFSCDLLLLMWSFSELGCSSCETCPPGQEAAHFATNCMDCNKGQDILVTLLVYYNNRNVSRWNTNILCQLWKWLLSTRRWPWFLYPLSCWLLLSCQYGYHSKDCSNECTLQDHISMPRACPSHSSSYCPPGSTNPQECNSLFKSNEDRTVSDYLVIPYMAVIIISNSIYGSHN